jgi:hypothetical protein
VSETRRMQGRWVFCVASLPFFSWAFTEVIAPNKHFV